MANRETSLATDAAEELFTIAEDYDCLAFKAHALLGRGAIKLASGEAGDATLSLREGWSIFNKMGLPYDAARARVLLAKAYQQAGNHEDARLQLEAAFKTFEELDAKPDLEELSAMMAQSQ